MSRDIQIKSILVEEEFELCEMYSGVSKVSGRTFFLNIKSQ